MTLQEPQLCSFTVQAVEATQLESHRIAYWRWGSLQASKIIICVHGLTRQGRDFDVLARTLLGSYKEMGEEVLILCPDVVGRGKSDWLTQPAHYQPPTYAYGLKSLLDELSNQNGCKSIDWVGTSMGGIIGMLMCGVDALKPQVPIRRLVLNDVGPVVRWEFIERLKSYVGKGSTYLSLEEGVEALRQIFKGFGPHSKEEWTQLSLPMLKEIEGSRWVLHYDNQIVVPIELMTREGSIAAEKTMWSIYDQINCETLLIKGEESELMSSENAQEMCSRGPKPLLYTVPGVGHAPTLIHDDQLKMLNNFLVRG